MVHVLVIDDDKQMQELITEILTDHGYFVKCFGNGKAAIAESFEQLFNVALIDINLPDIDGTKLLTSFRKTEPEMIKIIITGNATLDNSIEAANKGVDGYILKPFDPKKLISLIENKLREQRKKIEFNEKKVAEYIAQRHEWMAEAQIGKKK